LEGIRYKDASGFRECDEEEWEFKVQGIETFKRWTEEWCLVVMGLSRQKRKEFEDNLAPGKRRRLEEVGIDFSVYKKANHKKRKQNSNRHTKCDKQFTRLKGFRRMNGPCMVPKRYENNPSLGVWVSNQRQRYPKRQQQQQQELSLDDELKARRAWLCVVVQS